MGDESTVTLGIPRLTEAWQKYALEIKYKKGSEIPPDFLNPNVIITLLIFNGNWKIAQIVKFLSYTCNSGKHTNAIDWKFLKAVSG